MQKLNLSQSLSQKLSPQQIQFIKLLQVPTAELDARIEEELEINPALEEGKEEKEDTSQDEYEDSYEEDLGSDDRDLNLDDYLDDEYGGYKMQGDGNYNSDEEDREIPISSQASLHELLIQQLNFLKLDERQKIIGQQLIGSIENDGYIRRDLEAIINDLAFSQNIETDIDELEEILRKIQTFDPAGIASRNLQECLILQLERKEHPEDPTVQHALRIMHDCFEEFTKKHYSKIQRKCDLNEDEIKDAVNLITKLNPKPGGVSEGLVRTQYIIPDFILTNNSGKLEISLNSKNAPELRISRSYADMFDAYDKSDKKDKKLKETVTFVKQKLDAAKWFIDAIKQRQNTLLRTMEAILQYQKEFFLDGDETNLRPMILKDIAEKIDMDISTVSRVANSKSIQTEFGVYPLKYFFSEGIATDSGEDVSNREVKSVLQAMVDEEDKKRPLSDDKLVKMLNKKGYNIARRTVAKYREQLQIPVARLRKEL
ncbi:MAG TPA: RNA polymerase sigma-54 factor [Algoriphagus sp.]|jgi:RNA polymerase sigma-54 factor|uniref:RNA polymerase factor sigma-54 n=2 Tax=Algoriphagus TaxID=246875 RepID=UPI000C39AC3E|nr:MULTISPECIES: RNA polymerase factor sigma-54 [unclassified Algoriphagus]MAL15123.1 RNA polymerase sigma-54 factor [Algoriphagus sp.]MAN87888.1 RNA polymerase sigma-54 factor [Algoriphagus sp.]QYH39676.1 RNA polymerase factor sigma-54 [Algoriphagus sp. NBT04N3]HAS57279.1 RNA polymerase sigma-54 factor [Algoriphagus sp.]HAZ24306.1 RNA polymerase sigma-54 factor [Algoriphagus sp.]|tara:strand:+ start:38 stop:1492 length:1455 start_codon:yes stop_codon:yes gene_type:complete